MKTKLRSLRNEYVQGVQDGEEEDAGRGDRGGDVAEDVDLRPARALRPVAQVERHAAGLQRGPHRPPHVDRLRLAAAALLVAERRQAPLHLRDGAVHGGQVLGRVGRQRPVQLGQRPGGEGLGALDQVAFELAPQVPLEAVELLALDRRRLGGVVLSLRLLLGAGREPERAADPLHVDPDHAGALGAAAEGGDRQPRQVAHLGVVAGQDRLADLFAQLVDVEPLAALVAAVLLGDLPRDRLGLGGAEEEALEEQLEDPAILLRLGDRRGQRLAEVVLGGPGNLLQRGEGVEDLRGADRHPLAAQFLAEAEQLRRQPRRPRVSWGRRGSASFTPTRSATRSMSVRCLTMIDIDWLKVSRSMSSAPISSSVRAQSIDSAIEGGFLRSSARTIRITSTSRRASVSGSSGVCRRTISSSRSRSG